MGAKKKQQELEQLSPKALASLVNKRYGPGTIKFGNDESFEIQRIPTGVLSLDYMLGGGFPCGRHIEIYGSYGVGKTYTAYRTIASAQEIGLPCAYIDAEHTFDPQFAASAGVNVDELVIHSQEHGNRVIDMMDTLLRSGDYGVIALDSIASLLPKSELESDMEAGSMGTEQARLMSKALRKLTAANRSTVLIYMNQLRESIGVMFGRRKHPTGGQAMSFYAGIRLEMSRVETLKEKRDIVDPKTGDKTKKQVVVGHRVLVRIDKEKTGGGTTGNQTSFVFNYGIGGVDHVEDLIYLGRQLDLVHKQGNSWWIEGYEDEKKRSRGAFVKFLREDDELQEDLEQRIVEGEEEE